jgi:hypothetical protein
MIVGVVVTAALVVIVVVMMVVVMRILRMDMVERARSEEHTSELQSP